uniref:Serpentine Receptor, class T n=1 Tax=Panagrellus redivivus TaxID=6233 RepID=A0A7E4VWH8_PANRE
MTTDNYFDVSPDFPYKTLCIVTNGIGLVIEVLTIIHTVAILRLSHRVSVIHPHMRAAAYSLWVCIILKSIANASFHISNMLFWYPLESTVYPKFFYDFFKDATNMGIYVIPLANVCERVWATICVTKYEHWVSYTFISSLCVISWTMTIWLTVHLMFFNAYMNVLYLYLGYNAILVASYVVYFVLNHREKSNIKYYLSNATLSERYQRAKNQACFQTMFRFAVSSLAIVIVACIHNITGLYILPHYFPEVSRGDKIAYFRIFITMCSSIIVLTLPLHFAYINPTLLKRYK